MIRNREYVRQYILLKFRADMSENPKYKYLYGIQRGHILDHFSIHRILKHMYFQISPLN